MIHGAGLDRWIAALRERHAGDLSFPEIRKGVVALSRIYVQERERLGTDVFDGAGKRAAFACYYTPLHFLLVREIVLAVGADSPPPRRIFDYGCGLGAAGAAWALHCRGDAPAIEGFDVSAWAAREARAACHELGLRARVRRVPVERAPLPREGEAIVAAFAVNELAPEGRGDALLRKLLGAGRDGAAVLVVEPLARRRLRWWDAWAEAFGSAGGRADEWRFPVERPRFIVEMDRASGLDHRELTGRSLYLGGR